MCAVRIDGRMYCYGCAAAMGLDDNLRDTMPRDVAKWKKVEVSSDGKWAVGWADNYVGPLSSDWMPTTSEGWLQFEFPCGITVKGRLECFGYYAGIDETSTNTLQSSSYKRTRQVAPAFRQRRFKHVSSDGMRTCGIAFNDRLLCFGSTDFGFSKVGHR